MNLVLLGYDLSLGAATNSNAGKVALSYCGLGDGYIKLLN